MKKIFLLCLALLLIAEAGSQVQFGLRIGSQYMQAEEWKNVLARNYELPGIQPFQPGYNLGLDLRFPLRKRSIELSPELSFSGYVARIPLNDEDFVGPPVTDIYKIKFYTFQLHGDFYLLDFRRSESGTTYSRPGHWFKKGLFIRGSLGFNWIIQSNLNDLFGGTDNFFFDPNSKVLVNPNWGIGIGLDYGVNDFLTITPLVQGTFFGQVRWKGFAVPTDPNFQTQSSFWPWYPSDPRVYKSVVSHYFLGIRLGLRFDQIGGAAS